MPYINSALESFDLPMKGYYGLSAALGEMASGQGWMHRCTTVLASHGSRLNKLPMTSVGPRRTPLARRRSAPL